MKRAQKVIYYGDELNDEFSTAAITPKFIGDDYKYIYGGKWKRFTHFFWYRVVALPLAVLYLKIKFSHKIVGKQKLKGAKGCFIYGNHTQAIADALIPTFIAFPKHVYTIVHSNNISMPFLGRVTPSMGALPLPDTLQAARNFAKALEVRVSEGKAVCVYPEAHIWPYYTKIRPFTDASFRYPVKYGVPAFCFTNTYKKGWMRKAKIVTYVDGPFFFKGDTEKEKMTYLRDCIYSAMCLRAEENEIEVIKYCSRGPAND